MAKKSLIQREKKRQKLEQKYHLIRQSLKKKIRSKVSPLSLSEKTKMREKLQSLPRNSAPTRLHRRCFLTGRRKMLAQVVVSNPNNLSMISDKIKMQSKF